MRLGRWIIVEGMDGSGKSTVARWIMEAYEEKGDKVLLQVHPSERWTGRVGRRCLQSKGLHMYALSTMFFIIDVLISLIKLRQWRRCYDDIIFVRYAMAAAYLPKRYVKLGYDAIVRVLPLPDKLLLVDIEPSLAQKRMVERSDTEEMFENLDDLTKVREKLIMLSDGWKVLDNNGDERSSRERLDHIMAEWSRAEQVGRS